MRFGCKSLRAMRLWHRCVLHDATPLRFRMGKVSEWNLIIDRLHQHQVLDINRASFLKMSNKLPVRVGDACRAAAGLQEQPSLH